MSLAELIALVKRMRRAQRAHYDPKATPEEKNYALALSKKLEKQVDAVIHALENPTPQPTNLFTEERHEPATEDQVS